MAEIQLSGKTSRGGKNRGLGRRYLIIGILFTVLCGFYTVKLINAQLTSRDNYSNTSSSYYTRRVKIQAQRGEIYDRNGIPLVINEYENTVYLDYTDMPADAAGFNGVILKTYAAFEIKGESGSITELSLPFTGSYPEYTYNEDYFAVSSNVRKFERLMASYGFDSDVDCETLVKYLSAKYKLFDSDGMPAYTAQEMTTLLFVRFDMQQNSFGVYTPYVIAGNVSFQLEAYLLEQKLSGAAVSKTAVRTYCYPGYASHILGRLGKIQAESAEYYSELGYKTDALVGLDGAEYAFEDYLRGIDGTMVIVEDKYGNVINRYTETEPVAGKDIYLTIDMKMQIVAEDALADNIKLINDKALATAGELDGEDADAGALTVIDPNTCEVLAMASNPTFDLSVFSESYAQLSSDKGSPLVNRATQGLYQPGSTFKIAVAAAALTDGVITPSTIIVDRGVYTYYSNVGFTMRCWIYVKYPGQTHGPQNVIQAIQNSCNYFFYETGRLLTIDKLNDYCRKLGLGEKTGLEDGFPEKAGILAGPDYTENNGLGSWLPGDTLQASIGQSYNMFTPVAITSYMSAILNGGVRYRVHLLYKVCDFADGGEGGEVTQPEVLSTAELSKTNLEVLKSAMKSVTENGSAARLFSNYPIPMGGKTGTAETGTTQSANALFTAFAPYDNPEIVATCVIEKGANGTDAGNAVKAVFNYYFGLDENGNAKKDTEND